MLAILCSALLGIELSEREAQALTALLHSRPLYERAGVQALVQLFDVLPLARAPFRRLRGLDAEAQAAWIERWAGGRITAARVLAALRSLAALAAYGDEQRWRDIGYDGPWLGRLPVTVFPELVPPDARRRGNVLTADVCVIGSGAGGAAAAARLAGRGLAVVVLEKGPRITAAQYTQRELAMLELLYAERGLAGTTDQGITILRGQGLGGSTLHNTGLVVPPPAGVLERWREEHGFAVSAQEMDAQVQRVLAALRAVPIPLERLNANNQHLRAGAAALGWRHYIAQHNRLECSGCGYCMLGCAYNRKVNAAGAFLQAAAAAGALLLSGIAVERFAGQPDAFTVFGRASDGARITVRARRILVAAGALETPLVLRRSGVRGDAIGNGLRLHPAPIVFARFSERVEAWRGLPQAVLVNEHASFERNGTGGFLILPNAGTAPALTAASLPGYGARHEAAMRDYPYLASAAALLHDESRGRVLGAGNSPAVRYWLNQDDQRELVRAVRALAQLFLAAGAEHVYLPFDGGRARTARDLNEALQDVRIRPHALPLTSVHPQGSCALGSDSRQGALTPACEVWRARGVFVCDASVFPTSIGVPPQVTIMALAGTIADRVADGLNA